jgi:hypothetical protein
MEIPSSGKGSRKRGRPAIGKPDHVRLSESEKALALALGNNVLSKGVRLALRMVDHLKNQAQSLESAIKLNLEEDGAPFGLDPKQLRRRLLHALDVVEKFQHKSLDMAGEPDPAAITRNIALSLGIERLFQAAEFLGEELSVKSQYANSLPRPAPKLSEIDLRTAAKLGKGSVEDGMRMAFHAVRFFGIETVRKLDNGSNNDTPD